MDIRTFRKLFKRFHRPSSPLTQEIVTSAEYEQFIEAILDDEICGEWYLKQLIREAKIDYKRFCCIKMAYHLIEDKKTKDGEENYDCVITFNRWGKSFGIPVHDGGASYILVEFCPWCGSSLKKFPIDRKRKAGKKADEAE